jgi:16S rRNA (guanine1207-N2)-methyltransferase
VGLLDQLRRYPDLEAPNLFAVDATDRLLLDEAADLLRHAAPGTLAVVNDHYGALTLGAVQLHGASAVRVCQDSLLAERALDNNASATGLSGTYQHHRLGRELLDGATVILVQAPKTIDTLREIAESIARYAETSASVFVGGRIKHMSLRMNEVLNEHFEDVRASLARQKSRVLIAGGARPISASSFPLRAYLSDLDLWVHAHGGVFGGAKLDLGTRLLSSCLDRMNPQARDAVDLGCGTGILAVALARARPELSVIATDQSAAAVASSAATVQAGGLEDRVTVVRDDAMSTLSDESVDLIVCNPPFHIGSEVNGSVALRLFDAAGRVLRPGGELWTVYNSHLGYRGSLELKVGKTTIAERNRKFTVAVSTRPR